MANHYFITGFPGFIASSLIRQIIRNGYDIRRLHLLVLPAFMERAQQEIEKIANEERLGLDRFTLIPGDITKSGLGMPEQIRGQLHQEVTHVFHLAAVYDLAVPEDVGYNVNVTGTDHVNRWVLSLQSIQRYVYFSTCYEMNQRFKNHYEHTKYEAEVKVRSIMNRVPTTIIRPGIVVGHSKTGETIKFDGLYFILNFFEKLKFLPVIPYLGTGKAEGNFVPVIGPIVRYYKQHKNDDDKQLKIR